MKYGLIGERLGHSFSPEIHAKIADYAYELREIAKADLDAFMQARDFEAINVTIPYKTAVMPYLYEIEESARRIGAVNTVVRRGGKLYGYNTDYAGMAYLADSIGLHVENKKVLILGSGGTSLTAATLFADRGASQVLRVSRTPSGDGIISYDEVYQKHTDAAVIVNTTPVGMYPNAAGCAVDLSYFSRLEGVLDAVYNPLRTTMVERAKARGIPATGGLGMLVAQAVYASEHFTGTAYDKTVIDSILADVVREKEHLILIGMPSSGKSTVGRAIAERLGRDFIDIDDEIVAFAGCEIPQIFAAQGEEQFRHMESFVLSETLFKRTGCVIATGGGAILKEENVEAMHRTGRVFWIDRPLDELTPTADRPTASDREAIEKRYWERYELYRAAADSRIDGAGDTVGVTARLMEEVNK